MDQHIIPDRFYETIAFGESLAPMLWQVRVHGNAYVCSVMGVSEELAAKYLHGEVGDRELVRSDFVGQPETKTFADIEDAHNWFATDWDVQSQSAAYRFFAEIDPAAFPLDD